MSFVPDLLSVNNACMHHLGRLIVIVVNDIFLSIYVYTFQSVQIQF